MLMKIPEFLYQENSVRNMLIEERRQILWPTGGIQFQQIQRTIGEYKASEGTEPAQQPNLDLNSNDFLPDSIAIYPFAMAMPDAFSDVTDIMANRWNLIPTSPKRDRVQSK